MSREFDPIKPQTPDAKKILCMDCEYRDRTVLNINGKVLPVGATKMYCLKYKNKTGKPYDVLFKNADCERYKKENA